MNAMLAAILSERTHVDRHLKKNGCALFSSLSQIGKGAGERARERESERANGDCECGWGVKARQTELSAATAVALHSLALSLSLSLRPMSFGVLGIICLNCVRAL